MKRLIAGVVLGCSALLASTARANDSAFSAVGGTVKPMKGQHSSVRMESEKIVVNSYGDHYDTTVDFIFHNTGRKNIATMGFPESNYGDVADANKKTTFLKFSTSVDGVPFKAVRQASKDNSEEDFDAYWVKVVPFAAGQRRHVRVQYSSPYGGTAMLGFSRAIQYVFTGGNWKGDVARSDMELRVHTPGRWLMMTLFSLGNTDKSAAVSWQGSGGVFRHSWTNWEAEGSVLVGLVPAPAGWLVTKFMATDGDIQWSRAIQKAQEFTIPGKPIAGIEPFQGFPVQGFYRDGVTFVQLSMVVDSLVQATRDKDKGVDAYSLVKTLWDPKTKTRTLVAGARKFSWRDGEKSWTVDGKGQPLAATTFVMNGNLYVPAAPLMAALGGTLTSDSKARWIAVKMPSVK